MEKNAVANMWEIYNIARSLRCNAPEMAILFVLKFTSDNAEQLGIKISRLSSFDSIVELYVKETITQYDFTYHCRELIEQTSLARTGAAELFSQFVATSHDETIIKRLLYAVRITDMHDDPDNHLIADAFLAFLSKDTGWDEQCKSSSSIAKLMSDLAVNDRSNTIYDGLCGYGVGLAYAHSHNRNAQIYGQDINANCAIVATSLQWMLFNKKAVIRAANTLRDPLPCNANYPSAFDSIIIDPPFGFRFDDEDIITIPENMLLHKELTQRRGDWLFVQHALAVLKPNGTAVVQTTMSTLFASGKAAEIRRTILKGGYIAAVIEFPGGMVPGTAIPVSLLVLKNDGPSEEFLLVNMASSDASEYFTKISRSSTTLSEVGLSFVKNVVKNREEIQGISTVVTLGEIESKNYVLTPSAYLTVATEEYTTVPLNQVIQTMKDLENELKNVDSQLEIALAELTIFD